MISFQFKFSTKKVHVKVFATKDNCQGFFFDLAILSLGVGEGPTSISDWTEGFVSLFLEENCTNCPG